MIAVENHVFLDRHKTYEFSINVIIVTPHHIDDTVRNRWATRNE